LSKCKDCKNNPCGFNCQFVCIFNGYNKFKQKENIRREEIEHDKPIDIYKDYKNYEDAKDEFTLTYKDISDKLDRIIELLEHLVNELK